MRQILRGPLNKYRTAHGTSYCTINKSVTRSTTNITRERSKDTNEATGSGSPIGSRLVVVASQLRREGGACSSHPTGTALVLGDGVDRVDDPRKIGEEGEQEAEPELDLRIDGVLLASKPT